MERIYFRTLVAEKISLPSGIKFLPLKTFWNRKSGTPLRWVQPNTRINLPLSFHFACGAPSVANKMEGEEEGNKFDFSAVLGSNLLFWNRANNEGNHKKRLHTNLYGHIFAPRRPKKLKIYRKTSIFQVTSLASSGPLTRLTSRAWRPCRWLLNQKRHRIRQPLRVCFSKPDWECG